MEWHKGKIVKEIKQKTEENDIVDVVLKYYNGDNSGYTDHDIEVSIGKDGSVHFCGDPEYEQVYLYPEQVKLLFKILVRYKDVFYKNGLTALDRK